MGLDDVVLVVCVHGGTPRIMEGGEQFQEGREAPTGDIADFSWGRATPYPPLPLIIVGIVDFPRDNLTSIPGEGRAAALHHAPHLVASIYLEDASGAFWATARLGLDGFCRFHRGCIARVGNIPVGANHHQTVGAGPFVARPALVGTGEEAAAVLISAFHDELTLLSGRRLANAVVEILVAKILIAGMSEFGCRLVIVGIGILPDLICKLVLCILLSEYGFCLGNQGHSERGFTSRLVGCQPLPQVNDLCLCLTDSDPCGLPFGVGRRVAAVNSLLPGIFLSWSPVTLIVTELLSKFLGKYLVFRGLPLVLYKGLHRWEKRLLTLYEDLAPVLPESCSTESEREVVGHELCAPSALTVHAVGIFVAL